MTDVRSRLIEDVELDVDAEFDNDTADETMLQISRVYYLTTLLLEAYGTPDSTDTSPEAHELREALRAASTAEERAEDGDAYIRALEEAFRAGRALFDRDDVEDLKEDFSQIDARMVRELRTTIAYAGQHFGIDVELPPPSGSDTAATEGSA